MRKEYLSQEKKQELFKKHSFSSQVIDTGSAESQIALFTYRIMHLNECLKIHKKDHATRLGLLKLVGKRKGLLDYLKRKNIARYRSIISTLGLRK